MSVHLDVTLEELRLKRGGKWTSYDPDVIPAWVADMDFPIAQPIHDAIRGVLGREDSGYPGTPSLRSLAPAFANRMSERYGWDPAPPKVLPVGDLIQGMIAAVGTFTLPGEGVVIQTPIYPPFLKIVSTLGRTLVENPLVAGPERYEMDLDQLRNVLDDRTRVILLCNPHNPTGRVFERRELEGVAELALEYDLIVVSDEVHSDLALDERMHIPFASLGPEVAARTITLMAATKAFNIAGFKIALVHFGSRELRDRQMAAFPQRLLGVPNVFGIEATLAAWRDGGEWLSAVVEQLQANRTTLSEYLRKHLPEISFRPPEASYLAWLDCSALGLSSRPAEFFLSEARVAFNDGQEFSERSEDFVRLNFATSPQVLHEILERMRRAVGNAG